MSRKKWEIRVDQVTEMNVRTPPPAERLESRDGDRDAAGDTSAPVMLDCGDGMVFTSLAAGPDLLLPKGDLQVLKDYVRGSQQRLSLWQSALGEIQSDKHIIDIGAGIGDFTVIAARARTGSAKVFAIEAAPRCMAFIRRNLALNELESRVVTLDAAAWHSSGLVDFSASERAVTQSGLFKRELSPLQALVGDRLNTFEVVSMRVDSSVLDHDKVGMIRLDVAGAEPQVLLGCSGILDNNQDAVVLINFDAASLEASPFGLEGLTDFIVQYRFNLIDFSGGTAIQSMQHLKMMKKGLLMLQR